MLSTVHGYIILIYIVHHPTIWRYSINNASVNNVYTMFHLSCQLLILKYTTLLKQHSSLPPFPPHLFTLRLTPRNYCTSNPTNIELLTQLHTLLRNTIAAILARWSKSISRFVNLRKQYLSITSYFMFLFAMFCLVNITFPRCRHIFFNLRSAPLIQDHVVK